MQYYNQCGNCTDYVFNGKDRKGYCEYYRCYYYPDDSCSHQKNRHEQTTGCFITTIICNILGYDDNCEVLDNLRKFRNDIMQKNKDYRPLLIEYDLIGPQIADSIKKDYEENKDTSIWRKFYDAYLVPTSNYVKEEKTNQAISTYREMVNNLKKYYGIKLESDNFKYIDKYDVSIGGHGKVKILV